MTEGGGRQAHCLPVSTSLMPPAQPTLLSQLATITAEPATTVGPTITQPATLSQQAHGNSWLHRCSRHLPWKCAKTVRNPV